MYRSYKEFNGYSTAFRQWRADSHCRYIHGYGIHFKVWFEGDLDERNWVCDFGCFKRNGIKDELSHMFDHTTIVAIDDPYLDEFKKLHDSDLLQLRIMNDVGCEKFAEWVYNVVNRMIKEETKGRVNVYKVQCWEHSENMAEYYGD